MKKLILQHSKPNKLEFLDLYIFLILTASILSLILLIFEYKNTKENVGAIQSVYKNKAY